MGWDRKKRGPGTGYFYRSVRVGDRVKKVYLGRGAAGHEAAAELDLRRRGRREAMALLRADREGVEEADQLAAELRAWAEALLAAWLVLSGHHQHRGQWRKSDG